MTAGRGVYPSRETGRTDWWEGQRRMQPGLVAGGRQSSVTEAPADHHHGRNSDRYARNAEERG
jgi:hypothetical protein